ncbi:MAG: 4-alpha-glucanotransferase, partial [Candidatus Omnitrophica bacterium]|nr:4-alpha-glucanotransferase [Candidatus Omnitrophota bacterium]
MLIKVLSCIITVSFLAQDIVWAYPDIAEGTRNTALSHLQAPSAFWKTSNPYYEHQLLITSLLMETLATKGKDVRKFIRDELIIPSHNNNMRISFKFAEKKELFEDVKWSVPIEIVFNIDAPPDRRVWRRYNAIIERDSADGIDIELNPAFDKPAHHKGIPAKGIQSEKPRHVSALDEDALRAATDRIEVDERIEDGGSIPGLIYSLIHRMVDPASPDGKKIVYALSRLHVGEKSSSLIRSSALYGVTGILLGLITVAIITAPSPSAPAILLAMATVFHSAAFILYSLYHYSLYIKPGVRGSYTHFLGLRKILVPAVWIPGYFTHEFGHFIADVLKLKDTKGSFGELFRYLAHSHGLYDTAYEKGLRDGAALTGQPAHVILKKFQAIMQDIRRQKRENMRDGSYLAGFVRAYFDDDRKAFSFATSLYRRTADRHRTISIAVNIISKTLFPAFFTISCLYSYSTASPVSTGSLPLLAAQEMSKQQFFGWVAAFMAVLYASIAVYAWLKPRLIPGLKKLKIPDRLIAFCMGCEELFFSGFLITGSLAVHHYLGIWKTHPVAYVCFVFLINWLITFLQRDYHKHSGHLYFLRDGKLAREKFAEGRQETNDMFFRLFLAIFSVRFLHSVFLCALPFGGYNHLIALGIAILFHGSLNAGSKPDQPLLTLGSWMLHYDIRTGLRMLSDLRPLFYYMSGLSKPMELIEDLMTLPKATAVTPPLLVTEALQRETAEKLSGLEAALDEFNRTKAEKKPQVTAADDDDDFGLSLLEDDDDFPSAWWDNYAKTVIQAIEQRVIMTKPDFTRRMDLLIKKAFEYLCRWDTLSLVLIAGINNRLVDELPVFNAYQDAFIRSNYRDLCDGIMTRAIQNGIVTKPSELSTTLSALADMKRWDAYINIVRTAIRHEIVRQHTDIEPFLAMIRSKGPWYITVVLTLEFLKRHPFAGMEEYLTISQGPIKQAPSFERAMIAINFFRLETDLLKSQFGLKDDDTKAIDTLARKVMDKVLSVNAAVIDGYDTIDLDKFEHYLLPAVGIMHIISPKAASQVLDRYVFQRHYLPMVQDVFEMFAFMPLEEIKILRAFFRKHGRLFTESAPGFNPAEFLVALIGYRKAYKEFDIPLADLEATLMSEYSSPHDLERKLALRVIEAIAGRINITVDPANIKTRINTILQQFDLTHLGLLAGAQQSWQEEERVLFKLLLKTTLEGTSDGLLKPLEYKNYPLALYGRENEKTVLRIRRHNLNILREIESMSLDVAAWLAPNTAVPPASASAAEQRISPADRLRFFAERLARFRQWLEEDPKRGSWQALQKTLGQWAHIDVRAPNVNLMRNLENLGKLRRFLERIGNEHIGAVPEPAADLITAFEALRTTHEAKPAPASYSIWFWQRQPGIDIFAGNYAGSCTSLNRNASATLEFVLDQGTQYLYIGDPAATGGIKGYLRFFLARNEEGSPCLYVDSIDGFLATHNKDEMMAHLKRFAARLGIPEKNVMDRSGAIKEKVGGSLRYSYFHHSSAHVSRSDPSPSVDDWAPPLTREMQEARNAAQSQCAGLLYKRSRFFPSTANDIIRYSKEEDAIDLPEASAVNGLDGLTQLGIIEKTGDNAFSFTDYVKRLDQKQFDGLGTLLSSAPDRLAVSRFLLKARLEAFDNYIAPLSSQGKAVLDRSREVLSSDRSDNTVLEQELQILHHPDEAWFVRCFDDLTPEQRGYLAKLHVVNLTWGCSVQWDYCFANAPPGHIHIMPWTWLTELKKTGLYNGPVLHGFIFSDPIRDYYDPIFDKTAADAVELFPAYGTRTTNGFAPGSVGERAVREILARKPDEEITLCVHVISGWFRRIGPEKYIAYMKHARDVIGPTVDFNYYTTMRRDETADPYAVISAITGEPVETSQATTTGRILHRGPQNYINLEYGAGQFHRKRLHLLPNGDIAKGPFDYGATEYTCLRRNARTAPLQTIQYVEKPSLRQDYTDKGAMVGYWFADFYEMFETEPDLPLHLRLFLADIPPFWKKDLERPKPGRLCPREFWDSFLKEFMQKAHAPASWELGGKKRAYAIRLSKLSERGLYGISNKLFKRLEGLIGNPLGKHSLLVCVGYHETCATAMQLLKDAYDQCVRRLAGDQHDQEILNYKLTIEKLFLIVQEYMYRNWHAGYVIKSYHLFGPETPDTETGDTPINAQPGRSIPNPDRMDFDDFEKYVSTATIEDLVASARKYGPHATQTIRINIRAYSPRRIEFEKALWHAGKEELVSAYHFTDLDAAALVMKFGFYGKTENEGGNFIVDDSVSTNYKKLPDTTHPPFSDAIHKYPERTAVIVFKAPRKTFEINDYMALEASLSRETKTSSLPDELIQTLASLSLEGFNEEPTRELLAIWQEHDDLGHLPAACIDIPATIAQNTRLFGEAFSRSAFAKMLEELNKSGLAPPSTSWWEQKRRGGILSPLYAGTRHDDQGIGDLAWLDEFIEYLVKQNADMAMLLPTTQTNPADPCPYAGISLFANNAIFYLPLDEMIGPQKLQRYAEAFVDEKAKVALAALEGREAHVDQYLASIVYQFRHSGTNGKSHRELRIRIENELRTKISAMKTAKRIDYPLVFALKEYFLRAAFDEIYHELKQAPPKEFLNYIQHNRNWLEDYSLYHSLLNHHRGKPWWEWDKAFKERDQQALAAYKAAHEQEILFYQYLQWQYYERWQKVRAHARERGKFLVGDMPMYPAANSADVWQHQDYFDFSKHNGAPPEPGISPEGQDWQSIPFRWWAKKQEILAFWVRRVEYMTQFYDAVRVDHVLGLFSEWLIDIGKNPVDGKFFPDDAPYAAAQGEEIVRQLAAVAAKANTLLIVEDIGDRPKVIRDKVDSLAEELSNFYLYNPVGWRDAKMARKKHVLVVESWHDQEPNFRQRWPEIEHSYTDRPQVQGYLKAHDIEMADSAEAIESQVVQAMKNEDFYCFNLQTIAGETVRDNVPGSWGPYNWSRRSQDIGELLQEENLHFFDTGRPATIKKPQGPSYRSKLISSSADERREALRDRLKTLIAQKQPPILSLDLDDTLTPFGAPLDQRAATILADYLKKGGIIALNTLAEKEFVYPRVVEKIMRLLEQEHKLNLLANLFLIVAGKKNAHDHKEIYEYDQAIRGYRRIFATEHGTKGTDLHWLIYHLLPDSAAV